MLFKMLYFVNFPVGQVMPKNNLPEAILACLVQALLSNPALISITVHVDQNQRTTKMLKAVNHPANSSGLQ